MPIKCKVLNVYDTSIGTVIILGVTENEIPKTGTILSDAHGLQWKIVGLGSNKKEVYLEEVEDDFVSIWDCKVIPIKHVGIIKKDMILFM